MEKEKNDKKKILLVFAIAVFLVLIVSATYAFFSVNTISNFGTSTINAAAGGIGTVTLNGNSAQLSMSLTRLDMAQGSSDITFYASTSGKTTTPTTVTLGTASVSPNTDTNTYHCTYTLSVTHSGTNDLYDKFNHQTNSTYDYTNRSAGQIILTINGVDYDFYNGWPTNNRVTGEFNIKGNQTVDITAGLRFLNKSSINQNYLAGTDLNITINVVNGTLSCEVVDVPTLTLLTDTGTTGLSTGDAVRVAKNGMENQDFYVVSTDASETVLLAKYNLLVGDVFYAYSYGYSLIQTMNSSNTSGYGLQSSTAKGCVYEDTQCVGVVPFSGTNYWDNSVCQYTGASFGCTGTSNLKSEYATNGASYSGNPYPNVYRSNMNTTAPSIDYSSITGDSQARNNGYTIAYYVEEYVQRLGINGTGRLLTYEEEQSLESSNSSIVFNGATYWLGSASDTSLVWMVYSGGRLSDDNVSHGYFSAVRPVIVVNTFDIDS